MPTKRTSRARTSGPTKSGPRCRRAPRSARPPSKRTPEEERAAGEAEIQAKIAEMPEPDRAMAAAHPRARHGQRAGARAEDVLRDAGLRQGRQDDLLLQAQVEVQGALLDVRLPAATRSSTTATCGRSRSP